MKTAVDQIRIGNVCYLCISAHWTDGKNVSVLVNLNYFLHIIASCGSHDDAAVRAIKSSFLSSDSILVSSSDHGNESCIGVAQEFLRRAVLRENYVSFDALSGWQSGTGNSVASVGVENSRQLLDTEIAGKKRNTTAAHYVTGFDGKREPAAIFEYMKNITWLCVRISSRVSNYVSSQRLDVTRRVNGERVSGKHCYIAADTLNNPGSFYIDVSCLRQYVDASRAGQIRRLYVIYFVYSVEEIR